MTKDRTRFSEPSPEHVEQGRRFGIWYRSARDSKGWRNVDVHEATGISNTYLGVLAKDGINSSGSYQRPSPLIIEKLAAALDANEDAGREAAGYIRQQVRQTDHIVLESGATYTFVANPYGIDLELEITPELLEELKLHSELQRLRREHNRASES